MLCLSVTMILSNRKQMMNKEQTTPQQFILQVSIYFYSKYVIMTSWSARSQMPLIGHGLLRASHHPHRIERASVGLSVLSSSTLHARNIYPQRPRLADGLSDLFHQCRFTCKNYVFTQRPRLYCIIKVFV
jgi:hypothetical protein